jgi:hypothetical protein
MQNKNAFDIGYEWQVQRHNQCRLLGAMHSLGRDNHTTMKTPTPCGSNNTLATVGLAPPCKVKQSGRVNAKKLENSLFNITLV